MKLNCEPGDLAIIVKDKYCPQDIGKIVEVLHEGDHDWEDRDGFHWYARSVGSKLTCRLYEDTLFTGEVELSEYANISDHCLRPIRDREGEDETLSWNIKEETV